MVTHHGDIAPIALHPIAAGHALGQAAVRIGTGQDIVAVGLIAATIHDPTGFIESRMDVNAR